MPAASAGAAMGAPVTASDNDATARPHDEQKRLLAGSSAAQTGQRIDAARIIVEIWP